MTWEPRSISPAAYDCCSGDIYDMEYLLQILIAMAGIQTWVSSVSRCDTYNYAIKSMYIASQVSSRA